MTSDRRKSVFNSRRGVTLGADAVRGKFDVPGADRQLLVIDPHRSDENNIFRRGLNIPTESLAVWGGLILGRTQGGVRGWGAVAYAERMFAKPGISIVAIGLGKLSVLAFTEIQEQSRYSVPPEYTFTQAGVTWRHTNLEPEALAPEIYHHALAAAIYCNVVDLHPEARVYVQGYAGDTRSHDAFLGERAGFEAVPGPDWGHAGARLVSTAGEIAVKLRFHYPFLGRNLAEVPPQAIPPQ